jgi:DNA primase
MAYRRRNDDWTQGTTYTADQVESVLIGLGIIVDSEAADDLVCFCPFHGNSHTPAMAVSKETGLFICYNPSCEATGRLVDLVVKIGGRNPMAAARYIAKARSNKVRPLQERIQRSIEAKQMPHFSQDKIDEMKAGLWESPEALKYMHGRGFDDSTLREFEIGYSAKRQLVSVPMHDIKGEPVGVIGRSIMGKQFKNSKRLPTSRTLFNIHRARKSSAESVIICEASFTVMRFAQVGYPNAVAMAGGFFNQHHLSQLEKYFSSIIIATDFDDRTKHFHEDCAKCRKRDLSLCAGHNPGRDLGQKIADQFSKSVFWAALDYKNIYDGEKDPDDLSDTKIRRVVQNAVSNHEYQSWLLY